ncbi:MAG TPA: hypothetical protein VK498_12290 [Ferruginibacter sp.]|nr:hypothetical protein [Ferruginibacter sp.]
MQATGDVCTGLSGIIGVNKQDLRPYPEVYRDVSIALPVYYYNKTLAIPGVYLGIRLA